MNKEQQNSEIEMKSKLALLGGDYFWGDTPIGTTDLAEKTDPIAGELRRPGWWQERRLSARDSARFLTLLEKTLLEKISRTRDGVEEENVWGEEAKKRKRERGEADDEAEEWRGYLGKPSDDARAWLTDLPRRVDVNTKSHAPFYSILTSYIQKLRQGAKVKEISETVLETCLTELCK
jgi:hypothetical protein